MNIEVRPENIRFFEALSSETRVRIIEMLNDRPMNIKDMAQQLGVSSAIVTRHIGVLEAAGMVKSEVSAGKRGVQKICMLDIDHIMLLFRYKAKSENRCAFSIPIGQYSSFNVRPTCGLASVSKIIGAVDDPRYFADPEHVSASHLWFAGGHIEYCIPNYLLSNQKLKRIEISLEICSEAPGYNENWLSDISFYINDVYVGMWTSPGDFGSTRGIFTPDWWGNRSQHGVLKTISVNDKGSYIDGIMMSAVTLDSIGIEYGKEVSFRIASLETVRNPGGVSLFGKGFGNYDQDMNIVMEYI